MKLPPVLANRLRLPVIGAPMFILSGPDLVIAQCKAGVVGAFPALNARPTSMLDEWLARITEELSAWDAAHPHCPSAPFAINQIVHKTNARLERDVELATKYKVPIVITSLGARVDVNEAVHSYAGTVMHDVIDDRFAHKAVEKGADGVIAVAAGAGGHAGALSPMALVEEIRQWFQGPLALSGAITTGRGVLAAQAMGADFAYIGSAFIATKEAGASADYKDMIVRGAANDIVYTDLFTGVYGNYLRPSIERAGLDPDNLPTSERLSMNFASDDFTGAKAWKDIWGCGQGIGAIKRVQTVEQFVDTLEKEYLRARATLSPARI